MLTVAIGLATFANSIDSCFFCLALALALELETDRYNNAMTSDTAGSDSVDNIEACEKNESGVETAAKSTSRTTLSLLTFLATEARGSCAWCTINLLFAAAEKNRIDIME